MPGILPSELPVFFLEHFQHVAVPDLGPREGNPHFFERTFQREIGHQGAGHAFQPSVFRALTRDDEQQLVAVVESALAIGHKHAVAVPVERDTQIRLVLGDRALQGLRVHGPGLVVDVEPVRIGSYRFDVGAQLVEHGGSDVIGRTVRAVDHDLHPAKVERRRKRALAELDVAAPGVLDAARFSEAGRRLAVNRG